ncbi:Protein kinase-like domain [Pseudocohnilembus persalinus]|uniref:Cyclin-dependent kinase 2 homolog n=1 Tax=Pseudocohnilembus persalinus TaxID=266149 RepID=A0A0V0R2D2_PSEPJ|nr:Protein kinase-like domain [Pseudocohnilembus persalinus]|eukprot:KRX08341.1 Protein kinase-like domain [Pseudocohnilembus persalinus]
MSQYKLQGLLIIDIHSINRTNSVEFLLKESLLKEQIKYIFWKLQNNFETNLRQQNNEYNKSQSQNSIDLNLSTLIKQSEIIEENLNSFQIKNVEIPEQNKLKENEPIIITFDINLVWNIDINQEYFFALDQNCKNRNIVLDILPELGEITVISNIWELDRKKEKQFMKFQQEYNKYRYIKQGKLRTQKSSSSNNTEKKFQTQNQFYNQNKYDIEISEEYYYSCYVEIMFIGGGSFGRVNLYFDRIKKQLLAVKQLLDIFQDPIDIKQDQIEFERIKVALKCAPKLIDDTQIEGINRNILREIKVLKQLNLEKDERSKYINKLEGVVVPRIKSGANKQYQTILLVFQHFGGCEVYNDTLTCDIYRYLSNKNNYQRLLREFPSKESKINFLKFIFYKIMLAVGYLHEKGVLIRDLKDDNILIRRVYDPKKLRDSIYEIQLIDFGLAKNKQNIEDQSSGDQEQQINKQIFTSIQYNADKVPSRHPIYRFADPKTIQYDYQDDVYALGILFIRMHNYFQLLNNIDQESQQLISQLTGLEYDVARDYVIDMIAKRNQDASDQLKEELQFDEQNLSALRKSRKSIVMIKDIDQKIWNSLKEAEINLYGKNKKKKVSQNFNERGIYFGDSQDSDELTDSMEQKNDNGIGIFGGVILVCGTFLSIYLLYKLKNQLDKVQVNQNAVNFSKK